jgi:hypothetical protein
VDSILVCFENVAKGVSLSLKQRSSIPSFQQWKAGIHL